LEKELTPADIKDEKHGTYKSYIIGFILSIALTFAAYYCVVQDVFTGNILYSVIVTLCLIQVLVQLLFFLHLMDEAKPRNNLMIFLFMVLVIAILVFGSLWIMSNLDYRTMGPMNPMMME
jgi:cytochrome o ubiquinol oxidase operon protein cyoD